MNSNISTSALLLSGLFFSQGLGAQTLDRGAVDAGLDRVVCQAGDVFVGQDCRVDPSTRSLGFAIRGSKFRVFHGRPGDLCAIFVSFRRTSIPLPGGAHLGIDPVLTLGVGRLNADGEFSVTFDYQGRVTPANYYLQAISVNEDDGSFRSSAVRSLNLERGTKGGRPHPSGNRGGMNPDDAADADASHTDADHCGGVATDSGHDGARPQGRSRSDSDDLQSSSLPNGPCTNSGFADVDSYSI